MRRCTISWSKGRGGRNFSKRRIKANDVAMNFEFDSEDDVSAHEDSVYVGTCADHSKQDEALEDAVDAPVRCTSTQNILQRLSKKLNRNTTPLYPVLPAHQAPPAVLVTHSGGEEIDEMLEDDFCKDEARVLAECKKIVDAKVVAIEKNTGVVRAVSTPSIARTLPTGRNKGKDNYQPPPIEDIEKVNGSRKQAAKPHYSYCGKPGYLKSACFNKIPCTCCGKIGHKSEDCYFKPAQVNTGNIQVGKQLCTGYGKSGHTEVECHARTICEHCGKTGHNSSDCRSTSAASNCSNCGKTGHKTHECPRKSNQNRGRGGNVDNLV